MSLKQVLEGYAEMEKEERTGYRQRVTCSEASEGNALSLPFGFDFIEGLTDHHIEILETIIDPDFLSLEPGYQLRVSCG
ncbi:hypothetical protein RRG08_043525 [Elysia crispata]|uniref:Uncharacterized protein n=1 Tax=Elysia crispata TaxID=231223 RepID=A0AAE0YFT8_9GAST|nr:hypothetical protein RRG08_043525 [Elysia crispata]